jgi:hypothetical protein
MKKNRFQYIMIFACVALFFAIPQFAFAGPTGFWFDGGLKTVANNGAAVTIETQNPTISSGSYVSIWAMTAGPGASDYAQDGWWKQDGWAGPSYFYEYSNSTGTWYQKTLGTATSGSNNDFKVGSDSTTMYFLINGTSYGTVPLSTLGWTPNQIQLLSEVHNPADQNPGSVTNPISMGSAQYKNTSGIWVSASSSGTADLTTQKNNISGSGSTSWEVWDSRY